MDEGIRRELEEARAALERGQPAEALARVLAAWRERRAPALADLVDRVAERVDAPPVAASATEWHEVWLAREAARRPEDLGPLLRALAGPPEGSWTAAFQRLERLEAWPDDPRLTAALVDLFESPPPPALASPRAAPFYALAARILIRHKDLRARSRLRALRDRFAVIAAHAKPAFDEALPAMKKAIAGGVPPLDPEEEALVEALRQASRGAGPSLDELLAAIYANPDDDAPRLEYAKALIARGDPRGDFILLQLRRHAGEALADAEARRERELRFAHQGRWLGDLAPVISSFSCVFERGFPAEAGVMGNPELNARLSDHPAWATFRALHFDFAQPGLVSPRLRRLRAATNVKDADLLAFATSEAGASLEELSWRGPTIDEKGQLDTAVLHAFENPDALPRLRRLHLTPSGPFHRVGPRGLAPLLVSPVFRRLERLGCATVASSLGDWIDVLNEHRDLHCVLEITPDEYQSNLVLRLARAADGWALQATLGPSRTYSYRYTPVQIIGRRDALADLLRVLSSLVYARPPAPCAAITHLHIEGDREARPEPEQLSKLRDLLLQFPRLDRESRDEIAAREAWSLGRRVARRPEVTVTEMPAGEVTPLRGNALALPSGGSRLQWVGPVLFLVPGSDKDSITIDHQRLDEGWAALDPGVTLRIGDRAFRVDIEDVEDTREAVDDATPAVWVEHARALLARLGAAAITPQATAHGLSLGAISWLSWSSLTLEAVDSALDELCRAALLLESARLAARPATATWVEAQLAASYTSSLHVEGDRLYAAVEMEGWHGPHERGMIRATCGSIPLARIPADERVFHALTEHLSRAASWMLVRVPRVCRFCRRLRGPADMHDRTVCHGCAGAWLGVIY